jgi:CRISPR/Cas system CMR-associated protein Cmr1 (group 7 of RAMP superfamily)
MVSVDIKLASVRNAVRLINTIIANYYKSHNNQQKVAVLVYHNATLRALTRHFRGFFHWPPFTPAGALQSPVAFHVTGDIPAFIRMMTDYGLPAVVTDRTPQYHTVTLSPATGDR